MHRINTGEIETRLRRALILKGPAVFENPSEVAGYVCLEDLSVPPWRSDPVGWSVGPSVVAANIACIGVRNPAGSGRLVVLDAVSVAVTLAAPVSFVYDANVAATDPGLTTIVQNTDNPQVPLQALNVPVAIQVDLAATTGTLFGLVRLVANTTYERRRLNIVIPPGMQVLALSGVAANTLQGWWQGRVFLEPPV